MSDWMVERHRDRADRLHAGSADGVAGSGGPAGTGVKRRIRVLHVDAPAVVLGRAQPEGHVDRVRAAAAGTAVVRRQSGGGAVLVGPGRTAWVDVIIPSDDPLWSSDVGRAMWWVGEAWAAALGDVGLGAATVWRGPLIRNDWSDRVCFAGLGAGEVTVPGTDGRPAKVVGVAQRRTRGGALFQCSAAVAWQPDELLDVLALTAASRHAGTVALAGAAVGVGDLSGALVEAVVGRVMAAEARHDTQLP